MKYKSFISPISYYYTGMFIMSLYALKTLFRIFKVNWNPREETCWFNIRASKNPSHRRTNTFVENEDYIDRQFGIKVYTNMMSDRNEIILDYIDPSNTPEVANTDTAFVANGVSITNQQHLDNGYANGNFTNQ